ncbi:MAG: 3'-5' exonuclease [Bacteroidales bacterium]|nr:3'-5' exonuclease [Bacteroidales bacterium]
MLKDIDLEKILFLDIETVSQYPNYEQMTDKLKSLWDKKANYLIKDEQTPADVYDKAAIYAEFGKIVTISFGYFRKKNDKTALFVKSAYSDNEREVLLKFNRLLDGYFNTERHYLCAHNGKEFDFPYIARRSLIHGIKVADILNTPGAKPWEIRHLDTLELWKFGDYKHWTSLDLLTTIFNIPSPKTDIDGSMVGKVYWEEKNLERISKYCKNDVVAIAQLYLKYINKPLIPQELIFFK